MFSRENFAMLIMQPNIGPNDTFPGQLVQAGSGLDVNSDINFTQGAFVDSTSNAMMRFLASVFITQELFGIFQNNTPIDQIPRLIFVVYAVNSSLFQDPNRNGTGGVILSFLQSPLQNSVPPTDLEELVKFQFQSTQVFEAK